MRTCCILPKPSFFSRSFLRLPRLALVPNDPEEAWYMQEFGGGVLILDPTVSGRTFIPKGDLDEYEDLEFVSRA
jgi:hypothetical protein